MNISKLFKERILNKEYKFEDLMDLIMESLQHQDEHIIDYMENRDYFENYGYTQELKEEVKSLNELLETIPEEIELLEIKTIYDHRKLELVLKLYNEKSLVDLEKLVEYQS
jgi:histidinol phosphatase-like PHP family hydrolase